MKTKLTITIDSDLIPRAKRSAKRRRMSLSAMIEKSLRAVTENEEDFVEKWRGRFQLPDLDEPRFRYLKEKYVADRD